MGRINTSSPVSHDEKEEFSPVDYTLLETSSQVTITNKLLSKLPSPVNYILRRLPRELPKLLSRSYSPVSLSSFLIDSSPKTPSCGITPRPLVHISYGNWICRHEPHTCQASQNTKFVHISSRNWICRNIMQNLCTYAEGIEYTGTIEEVEIKTETKVTLRQEPHQKR